jgi:hypothetical protein
MATRLVRTAFVFVLAMLSAGALSSAASATTWTSNGPLPFTASTGATRILIKDGSGTVLSTLNCSSTSVIGTLNASASLPNSAMTLTPRFSTCTVAAQTFTMACNTDWPGWGAIVGKALGFAGGLTRSTWNDFKCALKIGPTHCTDIIGAIEGIFKNADLSLNAAGKVVLSVLGVQLSMSGSICASIKTGVPAIGAPSGAGIIDQEIPVVTPAAPGGQPRITGI